jgi:hypothetical protein
LPVSNAGRTLVSQHLRQTIIVGGGAQVGKSRWVRSPRPIAQHPRRAHSIDTFSVGEQELAPPCALMHCRA